MKVLPVSVSVVVPAYNEQSLIFDSLTKIDLFLSKNKKIKKYEIIVIDDGSIDSTRKIIEKLEIKNLRINKKRKNRGKGFSVREGMLMAKNEFILFTDVDLSTPIIELNNFFNYLDYDIIIASRNLKGSNVKRSFLRDLMSRSFVFIVNFILGLDYSDTQCGFKMFKRKIARELFLEQKLDGFSFDVEVLYLSKKKNHNVLEVPVRWDEIGNTSVNPLRDSFKMFIDVLCIRWF